MKEVIVGVGGGILAGFLSGAFGIGGGILLIPLMVFFLGFSQHTAQGTSLMTFLLPSFLPAFINYMNKGEVNTKVAVLIFLGMIAGSYLGSTFALNIHADTLKKLFGALLIIIGIRYLL